MNEAPTEQGRKKKGYGKDIKTNSIEGRVEIHDKSSMILNSNKTDSPYISNMHQIKKAQI